jgi:hypothetical protein
MFKIEKQGRMAKTANPVLLRRREWYNSDITAKMRSFVAAGNGGRLLRREEEDESWRR